MSFLGDIVGGLKEIPNTFKDLGRGAADVGSRVINKLDRITDAPLQLTDALTQWLNSPVFMYLLVGVAGLVALSFLKR